MDKKKFIENCLASYISDNPRKFQQIFLEKFNTSFDDANLKMLNLELNAKKIILSNNETENLNIPLISHKIWITNPSNICDIPMNVLKLMEKNYENLSSNKKWKHFLWINVDINLLPDTNEILKKYGVTPVKISKIINGDIGILINAFLNQNMFPFASNLLRMVIINKYGGIYSDIGWILNRNIHQFFNKFEYIINGNKIDKGIVSHNIIACKKNNRLFTILLTNVTITNIHDFYRKYKLSLLEMTGPRMLTSLFSSQAYDSDKLLLLLCSPETFSGFHNESWKKENPKFGVNGTLDSEKFEKDINFTLK